MSDLHWQYWLPKEMTVLAVWSPQTALEQSRIPYWKLTFLHRQAASEAEQPREGARAIMLFMQVCWRLVSHGVELSERAIWMDRIRRQPMEVKRRVRSRGRGTEAERE